jgi:hypothetical protein
MRTGWYRAVHVKNPCCRSWRALLAARRMVLSVDEFDYEHRSDQPHEQVDPLSHPGDHRPVSLEFAHGRMRARSKLQVSVVE